MSEWIFSSYGYMYSWNKWKEGNKKIYVPAVIGVNKGEIVGFDDETSYDTKGFETPQEYWNEESINNLKNKLNDIITKSNDNICTSCNS